MSLDTGVQHAQSCRHQDARRKQPLLLATRPIPSTDGLAKRLRGSNGSCATAVPEPGLNWAQALQWLTAVSDWGQFWHAYPTLAPRVQSGVHSPALTPSVPPLQPSEGFRLRGAPLAPFCELSGAGVGERERERGFASWEEAMCGIQTLSARSSSQVEKQQQLQENLCIAFLVMWAALNTMGIISLNYVG